MVSCFQGGMLCLMLSQSNFGDHTIHNQHSYAVAGINIGRYHHDLLLWRWPSGQWPQLRFEWKLKLLFFELIVVFCFKWSVVKHELVLLFFLNVRNSIVWTQINFPLQHIPCQILNFQSSRLSWPAARHSDTECWPTRANTTDCVSGWNRAKHCRPCLGAGGSHVCRNSRRAVLLWILCLYAQVRSIILRN